ncbi:RNA-dependent RNA polymerase [Erysiphe necator associated mitovirus 16]|nr:RNA-dependent RNA polymerase [Erysiphe necator associated mitovirus 16]
MSYKELPRYITVLENLFLRDRITSEKKWPVFRRLLGPIMKMWKLSGITFTITYWSEVLRLVICYIDERNRFTPSTSIWVKTHRGKRSLTSFAGLPMCLPIRIKTLCLRVKQGIASGSLSRGDLVLFKLLLTVLSFFRATSPEWAEVKKSTITDPFTGSCQTLQAKSIEVALKSMGWNGKKGGLFRSKPTIFQFSQKAGPNANLAILGIGIDLLGWMLRPKSYIQYCLMCYTRGYWMLLNTFVLSSVLLLPVAIVFYFLDHKPWLGRIAVLEEARGKRRLIGITDWWTQVLLRPLHDDIYSFLGTVPQDGTNDQSKPIIALLKSLGVKCTVKTGGKRLQSMDLSAATDRLPVVLQEQILNILGFEGTIWKNVLDREWDLKGETVRYSVGQPMGAYSSFACLALTHHIIVRVASIQAGVNPKKLLYAVLGDDGALAHEKVAKYYRDIFLQLGMKINPIKGFDGTVLEFAKQLWTINGYNISPLGAKNILLFMRNVEFLPSIIYELIVKRFPLFKLEKKARALLNKVGVEDYKNYRNWKRSADGARALPLINFTAFENLVLKLFFQKRIKRDGKFVTVKSDRLAGPNDPFFGTLVRVRIRVLMAIGPRSGLWYLDRKVTSWMFGSFIDGFWRQQFIAAVTMWGFWKKPPHLVLRWVKNDEEPTILDAIRTFKRELYGLGKYLGALVRVPWTYVPNWQSWEDGIIRMPETRSDMPIVHPLMNFMYSYIAVVVPVIPNLFVRFLKQLQKVITGLVLIIRWRVLESLRVLTIRKETDLRWCVVVLSFLLYSSWIELVMSTIIIVVVHEFMYSSWFAQAIRMQIHSTRGYSYWPAYDPMASSVTTLEKVADKVKLEDSGAYRSLMRMSSGVSFVHKYLVNRDKSTKGEKVVTKSSGRSKRGVVITTPATVTSKRARVITRA